MADERDVGRSNAAGANAGGFLPLGTLRRRPHPYALVAAALATTRTQLDPATWAAAWADGQAMSLDEAVAFALGERPDQAAELTPAARPGMGNGAFNTAPR